NVPHRHKPGAGVPMRFKLAKKHGPLQPRRTVHRISVQPLGYAPASAVPSEVAGREFGRHGARLDPIQCGGAAVATDAGSAAADAGSAAAEAATARCV